MYYPGPSLEARRERSLPPERKLGDELSFWLGVGPTLCPVGTQGAWYSSEQSGCATPS